MTIAAGCNAQYRDFNTFNHQGYPTENPTQHMNVLLWTMKIKGLSSSEKLVLGKIVGETVCRELYYTFISQKNIADDLEITTRTVTSAIKKLQELNWIAVKRSDRAPYRNITDFNVERIMALGTKHSDKQGVKKETKVNSCHLDGETMSPYNTSKIKDTSKEVSNKDSVAPKLGATPDLEKLRLKILEKKKPHKIRRTTG